MRKLSALLLLTAATAFAQLDDSTITVTATRRVTLQPDQMAFYITVNAPEGAGLDDVLAMLPGTGITSANLTGVSNVLWSFTLAVPLKQASATIALLEQLENQSREAVMFLVQGAQVSLALQQSQTCSETALVADAQSQAQTLAAAAGYTVGPVIAASDGSGVQMTPTGVIYSVLGTNVGFVGIPATSVTYATPYNAAPTATTCTAVVKFQLYSFH